MDNPEVPVLTLSIGSNIDAPSNIRLALRALQQRFGELRISSVYESEAVGFSGDNFLNLVIAAETDYALAELIPLLKSIEDQLGRDRQAPKYAGRSMDIDILTYGDESGAAEGLQLPRPEITRNAFVLWPLAELLPEQVHGATGKTFAQLWQEYDKTQQKLWPVAFDFR